MYVLRKYTAKFSIVNYTTRVTFEVNITQMDKFTYSRTEYQKHPINLIKNLWEEHFFPFIEVEQLLRE